MSVVTITSRNYPVALEIGKDFPKCICGGDFKVQDCFNKRNVHHGTMADCKECGEHFMGYNYKHLKEAIPRGQKVREKSVSHTCEHETNLNKIKQL